jgi:predicted glycoside hydrolase/deacetylase ChbG (UPF0249 family)
MGFSHGSNVANRRLLESGLVFNVSVLFAAPWWLEAVEILKHYPGASVGVHLCANAEWRHYKWGPVAPRASVPGLVNEQGYFFGSYQELNVDHSPRVEELEIEFRAQIERALASGLPIDYLDNHMGAGLRTPEQRAMVEQLADEYGLVLSGSAGEQSPGRFDGGGYPEQRQRLVGLIDAMHPDTLYRLVFHLGTDTPELQAMEDTNGGGVANMSQQRQWELDMLLSEEVRNALLRKQVRLVTYRTLKDE